MDLQFPLPGYADPDLEIVWAVTEEAFAHFPEVTPADDASDQERFRLLLGRHHDSTEKVIVEIEAVLDVPDEPELYIENIAQCDFDLAYCRAWVQQALPHLDQPEWQLVGYLHTHPKLRQLSWVPSQGDLDTWIHHYESGTLVPGSPFLFIIGGRKDEQRTGYAAYRIVYEDEKWKVARVKEG